MRHNVLLTAMAVRIPKIANNHHGGYILYGYHNRSSIGDLILHSSVFDTCVYISVVLEEL